MQGPWSFDQQPTKNLVQYGKAQGIDRGINQRHYGIHPTTVDKNRQEHQQIDKKMRVFDDEPVEFHIDHSKLKK